MPIAGMSKKDLLDDMDFFEDLFIGRVVTSVPGFLVGDHNLVELRNMRYMRGGAGIETRNGARRFNTTALGAYQVDKIWQHIYQRAQTDYQDTFIVTDERKLYKADSIPEATAGAGSLGSSLFNFTSGGGIPSFCTIEDVAIACNDKDLIGYSGAAPYCTAFYVAKDVTNVVTANAEDAATFYIYTDEVTDEDTSTKATFTLDTLATDNVNGLYVGFRQPLDGVTFDLGTALNDNAAVLVGEYWDGTKWIKLSSVLSGTEFKSEDCADISDWDDDDVNATSSQVSFDGASCFKFSSPTAASGNKAKRSLDVGTFGNTVTVTLRLYCETIGTQANNDYFAMGVYHADVALIVAWCSDGMFIYDGASWNEVGTNIVDQDVWTEWTFEADFSTPASATVDVYKDSVLTGDDEDCSHTGSYTSGDVTFEAASYNTANQLSYVDYIYIGSALGTGDNFADGTAVSGATMGKDGTVSWNHLTAGTEKPRRINGLTQFWYRLTTPSILDEVDVLKVTVTKDWRAIEDVTAGDYISPTGFLWYDATDTKYVDFWPQVVDGSRGSYAKFKDAAANTDIASGDYIYIGFPIRIMGMVIEMVTEYHNDGGAQTITPGYWDGTQWVDYASDEFTDGTLANSKALNQNGEIRLEDKGTEVRPHVLGGKKLPMFWYRLDPSGALYNDSNDEMRIWEVKGIPAPKVVKNYTCCLNFKQHLFLFGREDAPNTADYSAYKNPYMLSGAMTSAVQPRVTFGDSDGITAAINFYNEAIVFKRTEVWMMEGDGPQTFGTLLLDDTVGCVAPESVQLVRMWVQAADGRMMYQNVVVFQAYDGVYGCDGIKCWKLSGDINNYFDQENTEGIKAGNLDKTRSWYDPLRNEYHLLIYSGSTPTLVEWVLDSELRRWAGPWYRGVTCYSGASLVGASGELLVYGGGPDGRLYHLETNSYNDVNAAGTSIAIDNYPILGDIWRQLGTLWAFRGAALFGVAQSAGNVSVRLAGDAKTSEVTIGNISMVNSGFSNFMDMVAIGEEDSSGTAMENKFQSARLKFRVNTAGVRQQLYGYRILREAIGHAASAE